MKAIVLAAGLPGRDFPYGCKPKCLYHARGKVLLDIAVNSLQKAGIEDIRIVTGYRAGALREYARRKGWKVEFVFNERWKSDSVSSIEAGLECVDDDVLFVCADLIIDADLIRAFFKTDPRRLAWIRSIVPWDVNRGDIVYDEIYRGDIDNSIIKIPRHLLNIFENARERADRFIARYHWETPTGPGTGVYFGAAITETFFAYRPIEEVVVPKPIEDIDFFAQTDEYKFRDHLNALVTAVK